MTNPADEYHIPDEELHDVPLNSSYNHLEGIDEDGMYNQSRVYIPLSPQYIPDRGLVRYSHALKQLIPVRKKKKGRKILPIDDAGFCSLLSFSWMTKYIYQAYKKGLTSDDIPLGSPLESCDLNAQRLELLWQSEIVKRGPKDASLGRVIWQFCRTRIIMAQIVFSISCLMGFLSPTIFMRKLLEFCENEDSDLSEGLLWALALTACELSRTFLIALYWSISYRTGTRLRAACLGMMYRKVLRLSTLGNKSVGEMVNIFGNDGTRIFQMVVFGPMAIGGPIVIICGAIYIYFILGGWALLGMLAFMAFYPIQYGLSRMTGYYRGRTMAITDKRINFMTEILNSIKLIKMYAWEKYFEETVLGIRKKECSELKKTLYCQSFSISLAPTVPVVSGIVTFIAHVLAGGNLTAAQAFPVLSFMSKQLRMTLKHLQSSCFALHEGSTTLPRFKVLF